VIPKSVTLIGAKVFQSSGLKNAVIPDSVTFIGMNTFSGSQLETVKISDNLNYLPSYVFHYCSNIKSLIIPQNVTAIGTGAFTGCSSLTKVFYVGVSEIKTLEVFKACDSLNSVCVPPGYKSDKFCDKNISRKPEECYDFYELFNDCFEGVIDQESIIQQKKWNVIEWEKQTDGCIDYICDNKSGPTKEIVCRSTAETRRICLNKKCEEDTLSERIYVEIEMEPETKLEVIDEANAFDGIEDACVIRALLHFCLIGA